MPPLSQQILISVRIHETQSFTRNIHKDITSQSAENSVERWPRHQPCPLGLPGAFVSFPLACLSPGVTAAELHGMDIAWLVGMDIAWLVGIVIAWFPWSPASDILEPGTIIGWFPAKALMGMDRLVPGIVMVACCSVSGWGGEGGGKTQISMTVVR